MTENNARLSLTGPLRPGIRFWAGLTTALLLCALQALLFHLRWHHNLGATPNLLIAGFWIACLALMAQASRIRAHRTPTLVALVIGCALLFPGASTSFHWTVWTVLGWLN